METETTTPKETEFIGSDEKAICVGPDVRIIPKTWVAGTVIRGAVSSVILHREAVDIPRSRWVCRLTNSDVKMVGSRECSAWCGIQRQHYNKPALRSRIVEAARVGYEWPTYEGCAVDGCYVSVEGIQVYGMVHIPRKTGNDVGGGVIGQYRLT